jgi:hypothetical protein
MLHEKGIKGAYRLLAEKVNLGKIGWSGFHWIGLAQDRDKLRALMNAVMNLRVPWNAGRLSSGCTPSGLSSSTQPHSYLWT